MRNILSKVLCGAVVVTGVCAALPLQAGDRESGSVSSASVVSYADLNLSSAAGIDTLYSRLTGAAKNVCGRAADIRDAADHQDWKACYRQAMEQAVKAVGNPALARVHAARTGRDVQGGVQALATTR